MNIYLNKYKMTPNKIKRKTPAPSDPITTSKCESAVCGSKSTKSKLFYIKNKKEISRCQDRKQKCCFPMTDYLHILLLITTITFLSSREYCCLINERQFLAIIESNQPDCFFLRIQIKSMQIFLSVNHYFNLNP